MDRTELDTKRSFPHLVGIGLIAIGIAILIDQYLKTSWLLFTIIPISAIVFLIEGQRERKLSLIITGSLLGGLGVGGFLFLNQALEGLVTRKLGYLLFAFAVGWVLIPVFARLGSLPTSYWALIPGCILASLALCFIYSQLRFLDFVLYILSGTGLVLLSWGVISKLFGLIIPGSLLITIGPGIYLPWGTNFGINALTKTGTMLVVFSIGWGLIILFSRVLTTKFVWWPLIPGGVLAVVGWGLYIGGDPTNAASFIANTGSISLIIFGLYLLLLRKSIHH